MRLTRLALATKKELPADAEIVSHQLMLRAGLIRKLASGLYSWLPLGLSVLRKVEAIVREEMDRAGALELLMPAVQPAELWQESGRWEEYGPELLRMHDRHGREFCFGPTHEEVITDIARREIRSYKQLPVNYYQIQTKFRDEIRPRFGVMRAREFIMKDAYSFHMDEDCLNETYKRMHDAYSAIFTRLGLDFRAVAADSGAIGGSVSQEFHVLADSGEDAIAFSDESELAVNVELAPAAAPAEERAAATQDLATVDTPAVRSIAELTEYLAVEPARCVKTLLVAGAEESLVALVLRGDHELNPLKAAKLDEVASPLRMASAEEIIELSGCEPGFIGPRGLSCPVIADHSAAQLADFVCGANERDRHLTGVNWERDLPAPRTGDLRNVMDGDRSPDGVGRLRIARGIEVGHIFQLGRKYSEAMGATVLDQDGRDHVLLMGCYGIGVTRAVAAAIEQNHDERGIIWPEPIAPYQIALVPLAMHRSMRLREAAEVLYTRLQAAGFATLFDDREARPGVKFADMDLIGIPHRIVMTERNLDAGTLEYKGRRDSEVTMVPAEEIVAFLRERSGIADSEA